MQSVATFGQAELQAGAPERERHRRDPVAFFREVLGIEDIHDRMVELAEAVRDHKKVAVAGCHDSSKSFCLAALAWWWVICFEPSIVITTSTSDRQVRKGLWPEIRKFHANARIPLGGRLLPKASEWEFSDDTFMLGFATTEDIGATGSTRFHGFKSPNRLVIMDEATQIPRGVWESVKMGLSGGEHPRIVAAANPTDPACEFARCWRPESPWHTINISAFDLPNLSDARVKDGKVVGGEPRFGYLPTPEWLQDQLDEYDEGHPMYVSRALGQFPDSAITTLISMKEFRDALARKPGDIRDQPVSIGCDVALEGDDLTVIAVVKGPACMKLERHSKRRGDWIGDRIAELAQDYGITTAQGHMIAIDSTGGYGEAPERILLRDHGYRVKGENFGSKPPTDRGQARYTNRRTELWCELANWIRDEACLSILPTLEQRWLEDDLPGCLVSFANADQRRQLERKKDMKKRLGHSPDHGDALALALAWRTRPQASVPPKAAFKPAGVATDPDDEEFREEQNRERFGRRKSRSLEDHVLSHRRRGGL